MLDLRSPEKQLEAEAERAKRKREEDKLAELAAAWRERAGGWHPMESCPFEAFAAEYDLNGAIWISDGKQVALASVRRRFGRPRRVIKQPELAMTDHGLAYVGGEYEEIDAPAWWFRWEFTDQFGHMTYAGGEETGKEEVDFVPTHWTPARPKPPAA